MSAETVSVVIPTFKRKMMVSRAIKSALAQTHAPAEVIVVDDGSKDGTVEFLERRYEGEPRVKVVRLPENRGAQAARIAGIRRATSEWVAFLDSDDEWTADSLERRLGAARHASFEPGFVYGDWWRAGEGQNRLVESPRLSGDVFAEFCKEIFVVSYITLMVRRKAFETCGYPDAALPALQDEDMALTVARHFPGLHCGSPVAIAHAAPDQISLDRARRARAREILIEKYRDDIRRTNGRIGEFFWNLRLFQARVNDRYAERRRLADRLLNGVLARFLKLYFSGV